MYGHENVISKLSNVIQQLYHQHNDSKQFQDLFCIQNKKELSHEELTHEKHNTFNYNNTKIRKAETNYNNLKMYESLHIKQNPIPQIRNQAL